LVVAVFVYIGVVFIFLFVTVKKAIILFN
jgi:hypothetical protein